MSTGVGTGSTSRRLDDEHLAFRESFDTFLERHVAPAYPDWRRQGGIPRDILSLAARDGFVATRVPEEHGGAGVDDLRFAVIAAQQAMAGGAPAVALWLGMIDLVVVPALLRWATPEQQTTWLPRVAAGDAVAAVMLGNQASFVPAGIAADLIVSVSAGRTEILTPDSPGVEIVASAPGIGLQAAGLADVHAQHVGAGEPLGDDRLGECVRADLGLLMSVTALAGARAALGLAVDYVLERKAFGQPIARFQNTRQLLGQADADLQAGEAFLSAAIDESLMDRLRPCRAAALELHCCELYGAVADTAVQLHGGYGYMMEYPIAHAYADAAFWRLYPEPRQTVLDRVGGGLLP
jgi:alkylation response protein AidB-like acyl-CoA dehydrogenase